MDWNKEIVFASSDPNLSRKLTKLVSQGKLRKLASRMYTSNMKDSPEYIVRHNFFEILAWRYPNSVISHRSAIELRPTENGHFYLTSSFSRRVTDLPGITINIYKGHPPHTNDAPYNGLYIASEYRYILENLQPSRRNIDGEEKTLSQSAIEERLERILRVIFPTILKEQNLKSR